MSLDFKSVLKKSIRTELETSVFMKELLPYLQKNSILLLSGDLGAGKTTSVRYLCEHLGLQNVQSPTYAVHQRYSSLNHQIDHFDLYRLQSEEELVSTGFWDLLQGLDSLMIVEWFERIPTKDWLEFEKDRRRIFGLKIEIQPKSLMSETLPERIFHFFRLEQNEIS